MPPDAASLITRPPIEIFGQYPGYGFAGLGVSTAIGNFTQTTLDLQFPGTSLGLLNWQRTYNSHSGAIGALGPGWSTSFSASLVVTPAQGGVFHHTAASVTFRDEDGRILTFTPDGAGGFTRPQDLLASLTQNTDGTFTLTYNTGEVWSFGSTGQLTGRSMEGQQVALDYDSSGLLVRATHQPSGKSLAFSYDAARRLTSLQASDGRVVGFGYSAGDVTSAVLESVTSPGGAITRFEWSGTGQAAQVSQITNPDGTLVVTNTYDTATSRVTTQAFPGGSGASFEYNDTTGVTTVTSQPSAARVTFQADAQGRLTTMKDPLGNSGTFAYDANGMLTSAVTPGGTQATQTHDANGNVLSTTFGGATSSWTYDDLNRVTTATDQLGGMTKYAYTGSSHEPSQVTDANGGVTKFTVVNGLLLVRTDPDQNTTTFSYDSVGNLTSTTSPQGGVTTFVHDTAGNLTQQSAPSGRTITFGYDADGLLVSQADAAGNTSSYQYSPAGLLLRATDQTGASTVNAFDSNGRLTSVTDTLDRTTALGYDPDGNLTSVTDVAGNVTTASYDSLGRLTEATGPTGVQMSSTYDADGNTLTTTGPSGTSRYSYDARGNVVSTVGPTGAAIAMTYNLADQLTGLTDADGGLWLTTYNAVGNVTATTNPLGAVTTAAYTASGQLAASTDPLGRPVSYTYTADGQVSTVTNAQGGVTRFAYDQDGHPISVTTPAGLTTGFSYDTAGNMTELIDARGWVTTFAYNARGQQTSQVSPSGVVQLKAYDAAGQLTGVTDGNGGVTQYGYDNAGNLITITDAKGAVTRMTYDARGRQVSSTDPLGRTTHREFDAAGNLVTITDPAGHALQLEYDASRRLTRRTGADGTTVSYTYTAAGRVASMTDATGITRYAYDAGGRLTSVTEPDGQVFSLQYDQAGQRTALSYPDGLQLTYRYDLNGRLSILHDSRAGDAVYAVDPDGQLLTEQLPGRLARRYHYADGLLSRFSVFRDGRPVTETAFSHDPDGRILTERTAGATTQYGYDPAGQLVHATFRGARPDDHQELSFTYDAVGNRTSMRRGGVETRYGYDSADQLLEAAAHGHRSEFRYDESGRLIEERAPSGRRGIKYDGLGNVVEITWSEAGREERIQATYDGRNLLTSAIVTDGNEQRAEYRSASARYRWSSDQIPQILTQQASPHLDDAEHDQPGRLTADFAYGYNRTFADPAGAGVPFHSDAFGTEIRTDDTEDWAQARRYSPFGDPEDAPRGGRADQPELPRFGYRGELTHRQMIYLRRRWYDPDLGRFTCPDPLADLTGPSQARNPYIYGYNDPVNFSDPLGTLPFVLDVPGTVFGFLTGVFQDCTTGNCLHPPNALGPSFLRCVQGKKCLYTRGYYGGNESALDGNPVALDRLWVGGTNLRRERAAQALAIHRLNTDRIGGWGKAEGVLREILSWPGTPAPVYRSQPLVSQDIDWELGQRRKRPSWAPYIQGVRTDIVTGADKRPSWVYEVRQWTGPATTADVAARLKTYALYAKTVLDILFWNGIELLTFIDAFFVPSSIGSDLQNLGFTGLSGLFGGSTVYVWGLGNLPGHIYFAQDNDTPERVKAGSYRFSNDLLPVIQVFRQQSPTISVPTQTSGQVTVPAGAPSGGSGSGDPVDPEGGAP